MRNASIRRAIAQIDLLHFIENGVVTQPGLHPDDLPERLTGEREGVRLPLQVVNVGTRSIGGFLCAIRGAGSIRNLAVLVEINEKVHGVVCTFPMRRFNPVNPGKLPSVAITD